MKSLSVCLSAVFVLSLFASNANAAWNWKEQLQKFAKPLATKSLSDTQIGAGLKEAISLGIDRAVSSASQSGGYNNNPLIRIKFPDQLSAVTNMLKKMGLGQKVSDFESSVNRAAEQAAPSAKKILLDALFAMNIEDAQKLLKGGDTAATDYFKSKTWSQLDSAFKPFIQKAMNQYGAADKYNRLAAAYNALPVPQKPALAKADDYATRKALDGLFYLMAQEEKNIRTNPQARVTDLLKSVFSGAGGAGV